MDQPSKWKQYTVLVFEGGGTRGYASLKALDALMSKIAEIERGHEVPHYSSFETAVHSPPQADEIRRKQEGLYLPCHYFDYIAGTSTGGLTALALGRLRMSTGEFLNRYKGIAREVFGHWRPHLFGVVGRARYDESYLQREIASLVQEHTVPDRDLYQDELQRGSLDLMRSPPDLCRTLVVSKQESRDRSKKTTYLFRSFPNPERDPPAQLHRNPGDATACYIWEAGRATSAATTYLEPIEIDGNLYSDGGEGCNDSSVEVYRDIKIVTGYNPREPSMQNQHPVRLFLTFGTGLKEPRAYRLQTRMGRMFQHWKREVVDNQEQVERYLDEASDLNNFPYFKFLQGNVDLGKIGLDKCKEKHFVRMDELVESYLRKPEINVKMMEMATELVRIRRERVRDAREDWERFARCTYFVCKVPGSECQKKVGTREELRAHMIRDHGNRDTSDPDRWMRLLDDMAAFAVPREPQVFRGPK